MIYGIIGVFSAFIFYILLAFTGITVGAFGLLIVAYGIIYKIKAQLKPETLEFKTTNNKIFIWRRSEFKDAEPYEREFLGYERIESGIKVVAKELGTSNLKTSFVLEKGEYGEKNLDLLCKYLDQFNLPEKENPVGHTKLKYKPRTLPVASFGYIITIGLFVFIDIILNEDPQRYQLFHSVVSPIDYSIEIPESNLLLADEAKIISVINNYKIQRENVLKIFPQRYVSIEDFANSLLIKHTINMHNEQFQSLSLHFGSAYDENKLKRVYELIAKDIVSQVNEK